MDYTNLTWEGKLERVVTTTKIPAGRPGLVEPQEGCVETRFFLNDGNGGYCGTIFSSIPTHYIGKDATVKVSLQTESTGHKISTTTIESPGLPKLIGRVKYDPSNLE